MTATSVTPNALIDTVPGITIPGFKDASRLRDAVAIVSFALLTAAAAQVSIPLGFTPVPLTGQTFAVLLAGGVLGAGRGGLSQLLYVAMGAIGLPFYSGGEGGWEAASGATAGYLVGFVVAAVIVGALAQRGLDRHMLTAVPAFLAGTVTIYVFGATWLGHKLGLPIATGESNALTLGVTPFLIGDLFKAVLAGALLPTAWKLFGK